MTIVINPVNSDYLKDLLVTHNFSLGRELYAWAGLSMFSLALAGSFALLLAISRIPGIETLIPLPIDFFEKGLVIHVVFSFVVWFQAVFCCFLNVSTSRLALGAPRLEALGWVALMAGYISCFFLFLPAFLERGEATLNNYIPAITDPLYYTGLILLACSVSIMIFRFLINIWGSNSRWKEPLIYGTLCVGLIFIIAMLCFAIVENYMAMDEFSFDYNESLFWGGGHVLQFANTALLITSLYVLARLTLFDIIVNENYLFMTGLALLVFYAATGVFFTLEFAPNNEKYWSTFTNFKYVMGIPIILAAFPIFLDALKKGIRDAVPTRSPSFICLVLSPLIFFIGGILGLFVDGADTRTPAHYHGIIAGINLSFMGLFYGLFLPLLNREIEHTKALYAQIYLFGGGQLLACIGLFLAGGYGTPRKVAGEYQGLEEMGAVIGMYMNGFGALIAVIGGVMFIWMASKALLRGSNSFH